MRVGFGRGIALLTGPNTSRMEIDMLSDNRLATYTAFLVYGVVLTWVVLGLFFHVR